MSRIIRVKYLRMAPSYEILSKVIQLILIVGSFDSSSVPDESTEHIMVYTKKEDSIGP